MWRPPEVKVGVVVWARPRHLGRFFWFFLLGFFSEFRNVVVCGLGVEVCDDGHAG